MSKDVKHVELNEDTLFVGHGPTSVQPGKIIHSMNISGPSHDEDAHTPNHDYEGDKYFEDDPTENNTPTFNELVAHSMSNNQLDDLRHILCLPKHMRDNDPAYQRLVQDVSENMMHVLAEKGIELVPAAEANGLTGNIEDLPYNKREELEQNALGNSYEHYQELMLRADYEPMSAEDDTHPPLNEIEVEELRAYKAQIREEAARYFEVSAHRGNEEPALEDRHTPPLQDALDPVDISINRSKACRRYWSDIDTEEYRIELLDLEQKQEARKSYEADPEAYYEEEPPLLEVEAQRMAELQELVPQLYPNSAELNAREQEFIDDIESKLQQVGFDIETLGQEQEDTPVFDCSR